MYICKICNKDVMECSWGEIILSNISYTFYICTDCREKMTDREIYRLVLRKMEVLWKN